jgi:Putative motility protein
MNITMDVTTVAGASAFQQQQVANNVSTSVAAKVLDSQRTEGAAVIKLLEAATIPPGATGSTLDVQA